MTSYCGIETILIVQGKHRQKTNKKTPEESKRLMESKKKTQKNCATHLKPMSKIKITYIKKQNRTDRTCKLLL